MAIELDSGTPRGVDKGVGIGQRGAGEGDATRRKRYQRPHQPSMRVSQVAPNATGMKACWTGCADGPSTSRGWGHCRGWPECRRQANPGQPVVPLMTAAAAPAPASATTGHLLHLAGDEEHNQQGHQGQAEDDGQQR